MLKIGIMGMQHAHLFSAFINGINEDKFKKEAPSWTVDEIKKGGKKGVRIFEDDARVVMIWDGDLKEAKNLANACLIDEVVEEKKDMLKGIDAVMILTEDNHLEYATPFLESKISVFLDKPFAKNVSDAKELIRLSKKNKTILFSSSALRFAKEIDELRNNLGKIGNINCAVAIGPCQKDIFYYGIHTVEMVHSVIGTATEYVQNIGESPTKNILKIKYKDGKVVLIYAWEGCWGYKISVYGEKGSLSAEAKDSYYFFKNIVTKIVQSFQQKKLLVPHKETLEIVKILSASSQSLKESNKKVTIP